MTILVYYKKRYTDPHMKRSDGHKEISNDHWRDVELNFFLISSTPT